MAGRTAPRVGDSAAGEPIAALRLAWSKSVNSDQASTGLDGPDARTRRHVTADQLFHSLDGRLLTTNTGQFVIEVFGVLHGAGCQWIQLALCGPDVRKMMTVRLLPGATVQHAILTLSSWLAYPAQAADVVNVA